MSLKNTLNVVILTIFWCIIYAKSSLTIRTGGSASGGGGGQQIPRGCKWQRIISDGDLGDNTNEITSILACKLRTIGSTDSLLGNLSSYQIDKITSLKLECNDVLFFESSLETSSNSNNGGFLSSLKRLKDLRIEYCKIRYVPSMVLSSLRDLQSLSLRTHNTDWNAMNLEFHPESFRGMSELKYLDLTDNNIWSIPTELFCPLYSLKSLNLTKNRLTDIMQLGFSDFSTSGSTIPGKACNTGLEVLDLSDNDVTVLPDNGLSALRSLNQLMLQDNLLASIGDQALNGLQSLQLMNISNNRLIALPPELFKINRALKQLYLQNNSLAVLAQGLLDGLDRLEVIDLSQNELTSTWITRDTFAGLVRLIVMNLNYNQLTKIDQFVFRGLYSLQILNLENNLIEQIADNAFSDLKNLHALTLSHNKLKSIDSYHLSDLYVLNQLYIEANLIEHINPKVFENLTNLNDLSLNDNLLTEVPVGLGKLRFLKSLDLGKNKIKALTNQSFDGLEQLLGLRLVDNQITNITRDTFIKLASLHILNLASNQIKHIDQLAFNANPALRIIRLDNNQLQDISGIFNSLQGLYWLNVSDNNLNWFDYSHIPANLEWLDIHKNNITELGNYYDVRNSLKLRWLDVSFNKLIMINEASIPDSIESVTLNNNKISTIEPGTFLKKLNLAKVVLNKNELNKLEIASLALTSVSEIKDIPQFFIGDNPFHCDCRMEWLQRINELSRLRQHPRVPDLDMVMCTMELQRGASVRPLMELNSKDFLCKYESHCFALCHCCDYDACDCKMTCPDRCNCYHDHAWSSNIVDCGNASYNAVPERIPMDATTIYLDGNDLQELPSHMFIGKKKLEILFLNDSNIQSLHNRTFNGVPSLKVLHMENNKIKELRGFEFDQLKNLNELFLNHNMISYVGETTFSSLNELQTLTLSNNSITEFVPWKLIKKPNDMATLSYIEMNDIKWKCDCASLRKLQEWLKDLSSMNTFDVNKMLCTDNQFISSAINNCHANNEHAIATPAVQRTVLLGNGLIGGGYVPLLAAILVAIIGTALLVALACVFRQDVRLWAHAKYGIRLFKDPTIAVSNPDDKNKLYDCYMVYSIKDTEFMSQVIANELQHSGYNLYMHHRDIHASAFLTDSIQSACDASRKIMLLLSMNFLQSDWSQPQFRVALHQVLENIHSSQRRNRVILILTAPVELIAMDPLMQVLIRTCTVICWGEKRFWDKVRFALPDVNINKDTVKKLGSHDLNRNPNLRYTPGPLNYDTWNKLAHPGIAVQIVDQPPTTNVTPSQTTSNTEDESSSTISSQHYEAAPNLNYMSRSQASLGHVYSTIPETPQMSRGGRAYFV